MENEKLIAISKIFNSEEIRTIWNKEDEKYYISVVDVVGVLSESENPRDYWYKVKKRANDEEKIELSTICRQLKLKSKDGKYRLTDVCDIEGMFRIIQSVPSKNAEPIKQWLAKLGSERIDETFDPSLAVQRSIDNYRIKGYDEKWISDRIRTIQDRKRLTDVWKEGGIKEEKEYAILTNEIYKEWSNMTAKEYKTYKGLRKESLRDNMTGMEVALTSFAEEAAYLLAKKRNPYGFSENKKVAKLGGNAAKVARDNFEKVYGETVVTKINNLDYKYIEDDKRLEEKS